MSLRVETELNRRRNRGRGETARYVYLLFHPYFPLPPRYDDDGGRRRRRTVTCRYLLVAYLLRVGETHIPRYRLGVLALSILHTLSTLLHPRIAVQSRFHFSAVSVFISILRISC